MAFLADVVRGGIFLLLGCDGEVEVTVFLGEVGIAEDGDGGGTSAAYARAAAIVHVDVV